MVITIKGVLGGADLSGFLDRSEDFAIESTIGRRMDTAHFTLFDPLRQLAIPARAEVVMYDYPSASLPNGWVAGQAPIVDPPGGNTQAWTPRLFAGYIATADYRLTGGPQRKILIQAQDYTIRNKTTIVNKAYGPDAQHAGGWSDAQIVVDMYATFRPDIDTTNVQSTLNPMPSISFPVHTLEQMLNRVVKITSCYYRIDYYKRLYYGLIGTQVAPLNITDSPAYGNLVVSDGALVYFRLDETS